MTTYKDLLVDYDFYMPLNGDDTVYTSAGLTPTKVNSVPMTFATDNVGTTGSTQCLSWDGTNNIIYDWYDWTGTPNPKPQNTSYQDGFTFEFWVKFQKTDVASHASFLILWDNLSEYSPFSMDFASPANQNGFKIDTTYWQLQNEEGTSFDFYEVFQNNDKYRIIPTDWNLVTVVVNTTKYPASSNQVIGTVSYYINGVLDFEKIFGVLPQFIKNSNKLRPPKLRVYNAGNMQSIKIAHMAQWCNAAHTEQQITKRYMYGKTKLDYDTIVAADTPVYWNKFVNSSVTPQTNTISLNATAGTNIEFGKDSRGNAAIHPMPWLARDIHAINLTNLSGLQSLIATGNWSVELWTKYDEYILNAFRFNSYPYVGQHLIGLTDVSTAPLNAGLVLRFLTVQNCYGITDYSIQYNNTRYQPASDPTGYTIVSNRGFVNKNHYYLQNNKWQHVVWTSEWDSVTGNGKFTTYLNGSEMTEHTFNQPTLANTNTYSNFKLFQSTVAGSHRADRYSDFVIYDKTLSEEDIRNRWRSEYQGESYWNASTGNVWQIADKELIWDGTDWVNVQDKNPQYWDGAQWVSI